MVAGCRMAEPIVGGYDQNIVATAGAWVFIP
jgi:hypothetical protein